MKNPRQPADNWYAIRWSVLERDHFTCRYCGQFAPNVVLHVDHVVAVCEGGTDDEGNLVTACSACNIGKEMYRAKAARVQQRSGRVQHRPIQGVPSLDPVVLSVLADNPSGLTNKQLAALVNRDRSTLVKVLNRLIDAGQVVYDTLPGNHNPLRTYYIAPDAPTT